MLYPKRNKKKRELNWITLMDTRSELHYIMCGGRFISWIIIHYMCLINARILIHRLTASWYGCIVNVIKLCILLAEIKVLHALENSKGRTGTWVNGDCDSRRWCDWLTHVVYMWRCRWIRTDELLQEPFIWFELSLRPLPSSSFSIHFTVLVSIRCAAVLCTPDRNLFLGFAFSLWDEFVLALVFALLAWLLLLSHLGP